MKAVEWQRFLQEQRDRYGKLLFTPTELAHADARRTAPMGMALQRLVAQGVIQRYAEGRYGLPGSVRIEQLVPALDAGAYATGLYALHRHGLATQQPTDVRCFTNRRHNRSRTRETPLGRIVFVCITSPVYRHPIESAVAGPEQALCDFVYECRKNGMPPTALVTFRNLDRLRADVVGQHLPRYPATVAREMAGLVRFT